MSTRALPADWHAVTNGPREPLPRAVTLDRLRGFAVLLMVADHALLLLELLPELRVTVTRLAVPLFFLVAGHLLTRFRWDRWALCLAWGLLLPAVSFVESPNVLAVYAVAAPLIVVCRRLDWLPVVVVVALTGYANGLGTLAGGYEPLALVALLAVGALLDRPSFRVGYTLPRWLELLGRYPLTIYVGHVLVLTVLERHL